jgi:hypothetical protein|tara:strand:+ start:407 stop:583 length:177 start_codon:yes stop_codon:yes gene_type:complete
MIAYYPLEELEPPKLEPKMVPNQELVKQVGSEESELNYIVMAFIVGVVALAISDVIRA